MTKDAVEESTEESTALVPASIVPDLVIYDEDTARLETPIVYLTPDDVVLPSQGRWAGGGAKDVWKGIKELGEKLEEYEQPAPAATAERFSLEMLGRILDTPGEAVPFDDPFAMWAKPVHEKLEALATWRALIDAVNRNYDRGVRALGELLGALKILIEEEMEQQGGGGNEDGDGEDGADGQGTPEESQGDASAAMQALAQALGEATESAANDAVQQSFGTEKRTFADMPLTVQERMAKILEKLKAKGMSAAIERIGRMVDNYEGPSRDKSDRAIDELVDLERGSTLERMAACESVRLAHPTLRKLWRKSYIERGLLQYRVEGKAPRRKRGPMVILVDESGSMCGGSEIIARSVTAAVLYHAARQHRPAWVIPFDSAVVRIDKLSKSGAELEDCIAKLFGQLSGGGTNFDAPLREAFALIAEEPKADILMITDGWGQLDDDVVDELTKLKNKFGTRLFGYSIDGAEGAPAMQQLADEWIDIEQAGIDSGVFE